MKNKNNSQSQSEENQDNSHIYGVDEFSKTLKELLDEQFGFVTIKGQISGSKQSKNGHIYFDLIDVAAKDLNSSNNKIKSVIWKTRLNSLSIIPKNELIVRASGKISSYGPRSDYQLVVEKLSDDGIGALQNRLRQLFYDIKQEGLFDDKYKKIPKKYPLRIGVLTGETGAVIADIINRVKARYPVHVMLYSITVSGSSCANEAITGLDVMENLSQKLKPDVIIIARGGGSFQEIHSFSDEKLLRRVFASTIPIISAIGHEGDKPLLDYVADKRAPTPTGAVEMILPNRSEVKSQLNATFEKLLYLTKNNLHKHNKNLSETSRLIMSPGNYLQIQKQKLELPKQKLKQFKKFQTKNYKEKLKLKQILLKNKNPQQNLNARKKEVVAMIQNLNLKIENQLSKATYQLKSNLELLKSLSHQNVLNRGYAIILNQDKKLIANLQDIKPKQTILIETSKLTFSSQVGKIESKTSK